MAAALALDREGAGLWLMRASIDGWLGTPLRSGALAWWPSSGWSPLS